MSTKPAMALLAGSQVKSPLPKPTRASAEHRVAGNIRKDVTRDEMNISGNQVLLALAIAFLLTNGLIWAFVRYWLFAP